MRYDSNVNRIILIITCCFFQRFMSILTILEFPDPRLRTVAEPVSEVTDQLKSLIEDMFETMYDAPGIGLAATQVNVHKRIVVMDISEDHSDPLVFINPEVSILDQETLPYDEGCLSVPGFYETVERPSNIVVKALDKNGEPFTLEPDGLLATCIQHELDHLEGKLFIDYVSPIKRQRIRKKLEKAQRQKA